MTPHQLEQLVQDISTIRVTCARIETNQKRDKEVMDSLEGTVKRHEKAFWTAQGIIAAVAWWFKTKLGGQ